MAEVRWQLADEISFPIHRAWELVAGGAGGAERGSVASPAPR